MNEEVAKSTELPASAEVETSLASGKASSMKLASGDRRRHEGFWEWLARRQALRVARASSLTRNPRQRELIRRARSAAELGDRVFDALDPVWTGAAKHHAAELYRQSAFWSLAALDGDTKDEPLANLWERSRALEGLKLPWSEQARKQLDSVLCGQDFRALAELSEPEQQRLAEDLRELAHSALQVIEPADSTVRKLLFQRFVRITALALLSILLLVAVLAGVHYATLEPNLALGKPWRASSVWAECHPEKRTCGPLRTRIFFHTKEDESPWVEFDLGVPTQISEVFVKNRSDGGPDRAVPLVVEVSNDAQSFRQVARREDTFRTWTASFEPATARYVRLRVDRRSYFHLDKVEIRP